jgi:hypothetical protein
VIPTNTPSHLKVHHSDRWAAKVHRRDEVQLL